MGRSPWFDWATDTFDHADTLRDRIPAALSKAHSRARAGHDATNSGSLRIFGTALWEFQNVELVSAVSSMATARAVKFGGYELPVVENCVLFPLRYSDRAGVSVERARLPMPVSTQRERLFGVHAPDVERPDPFLDESWADLDLPSEYEAFPQLNADVELIVIAYACSLEAGILNVEWGRAQHLGNGELLWGEHSPLALASKQPLHSTVNIGGVSVDNQEAEAPRFDSGDEPGIALGLRHPDDKGRDLPPQTEKHPNNPSAQENDEH